MGFPIRESFLCMTTKLIILLFLISAGLLAQTVAGTLDIQISAETVPQGGIAQIKLFLSSPQAISSGKLHLTFSGGIYPAQSPSVIGAVVFSAAGDVSAVAAPDTFSVPYGLRIAFYSPSAGVGRVRGLPIAEFSIPVAAAFSVGLDLNNSSLVGPAGNYALTVSPGEAAIGGTLSIQRVTLSGSKLQIDGTGFGNGTSIEIDGAAVFGVNCFGSGDGYRFRRTDGNHR